MGTGLALSQPNALVLIPNPAPSPSLSQLASFCVLGQPSGPNFPQHCQLCFLTSLPAFSLGGAGVVCSAFNTLALVIMESLAEKEGLYVFIYTSSAFVSKIPCVLY